MLASFTISFVLVCFFQDSTEIQNVRLVLPPIVRAGTSATLLCLYDLEGASLYSVQWYRGRFEFFRYVPGESPPTKVFPIPGLHVDILASNERQVTLRNIPVQISGEFSCEVTTDAPPFSASCISENLKVVHFNLNFNVPKPRYGFGEPLTADCSVTPPMSSIKLKFYWNGRPVSEQFVTNGSSESAFLDLNTSVLYTNNQRETTGKLECSAVVEDTYYVLSKTVFIKLDPKPDPRSTATKLNSNFVFIAPLIGKFLVLG